MNDQDYKGSLCVRKTFLCHNFSIIACALCDVISIVHCALCDVISSYELLTELFNILFLIYGGG